MEFSGETTRAAMNSPLCGHGSKVVFATGSINVSLFDKTFLADFINFESKAFIYPLKNILKNIPVKDCKLDKQDNCD